MGKKKGKRGKAKKVDQLISALIGGGELLHYEEEEEWQEEDEETSWLDEEWQCKSARTKTTFRKRSERQWVRRKAKKVRKQEKLNKD